MYRPQKRQIGLIYKGVYLEVDGYYTIGQVMTLDTPPFADTFEIEAIIYNGVNVCRLLEAVNFDLCGLEQEVIAKIKG